MKRTAYRILALTALGVVPMVQAGSWSTRIEFGAVATSGNSESRTLNGKLGVAYTKERWANSFSASAIQTSEDDQTNGERYEAAVRSELNFSTSNYVFGNVEFEKDLFGGIRERTSETVGLGRRVLNTERQKLDVELGAGARQSLPQGETAMRSDDLIGRGGSRYVLAISETSKFEQAIKIEGGRNNTYTESISQLKLSIIGGIFANLGFTVKNNSEVPLGNKETDTISSVTLAYEFKQ